MKAWKPISVFGGAACAAVAVAVLASSSAHADLPPGYDPVPGMVPINPAHIPTQGSQFTHQCVGLPRPVQPGEVAWHFILPQSIARPGTPVNVFNTLTVTFQTLGPVTLSALKALGPPTNAHAYVYTPTDDTLTAGVATVGRLNVAEPQIGNDPQFNLSHTCASQEPPPTTTTTATTTAATTTTTTAPTTTTTIATTTTTTAAATTTTSTTTTVPGGTTTSVAPTSVVPTTPAPGAVSPTSTVRPGDPQDLPTTGAGTDWVQIVGLFLLGFGLLAVVAGAWPGRSYR